MGDDPEDDHLLRTIEAEEARALVEHSRMLRERGAFLVASSRRLRNQSAALGERVSAFLRFADQ